MPAGLVTLPSVYNFNAKDAKDTKGKDREKEILGIWIKLLSKMAGAHAMNQGI
jgi:hypothetical protein